MEFGDKLMKLLTCEYCRSLIPLVVSGTIWSASSERYEDGENDIKVDSSYLPRKFGQQLLVLNCRWAFGWYRLLLSILIELSDVNKGETQLGSRALRD